LKLIQTLYEKKVTTYPRVDTTYLPDDLYPKVPGILRQMTPYANLTAPVLSAKIAKSKKVFDNSKVTDHHAIIPTGQNPSVLYGDEKKMYHLIALRFIAAFYPDCKFLQTTVLADIDGVGFKAIGKVIESPGWRALYGTQPDTSSEGKDDAEGKILPPMVVGESGSHEPSLLKKQTQPPKLYTEGTLLRAMEGAGKTVEDEELREAMKENGIGRPSTRAAIIETLFGRRYIARKGKSIVATQAGKELIAIINEELLKSAKLTGLWENKLRRIERGTYEPSQFLDELKDMISVIVRDVLSDNSQRRILIEQSEKEQRKNEVKEKKPRAPRVKSLEEIICPECGQGHLIKGRTAYGCSRYKEGCKMVLPFSEYSADLSPQRLSTKLKRKNK
ncbi:MAG: DNA topoisomerase III, partial [Muribaculum sp.]|nr:DNA topoisomerase III [Muribaculum sp.]